MKIQRIKVQSIVVDNQFSGKVSNILPEGCFKLYNIVHSELNSAVAQEVFLLDNYDEFDNLIYDVSMSIDRYWWSLGVNMMISKSPIDRLMAVSFERPDISECTGVMDSIRSFLVAHNMMDELHLSYCARILEMNLKMHDGLAAYFFITGLEYGCRILQNLDPTFDFDWKAVYSQVLIPALDESNRPIELYD